MPYAFTQDVPIDAATYARIRDGIGDEPPPGLIVHLAIERPEGGLRYITVWESEADSAASARSGSTPSCTRCSAMSSATTCHPNLSEPRPPSSMHGCRLAPSNGEPLLASRRRSRRAGLSRCRCSGAGSRRTAAGARGVCRSSSRPRFTVRTRVRDYQPLGSSTVPRNRTVSVWVSLTVNTNGRSAVNDGGNDVAINPPVTAAASVPSSSTRM